MPVSLESLKDIATQVRRDVIRMVYEAQSGHPGGALGCTEYFVALFYGVLKHQPDKFSDQTLESQEVFILSNGHICAAYYSVLARTGYFSTAELSTFRQINSRLQGHPATAKKLPGVRVATGSLGQGLSVAIGVALARKLNQESELTYVLLGDGEVQEGQVWEAALMAAHHKVDNLIATIDLNFKQIDGDTRDVLDTSNLADKWRAFNWHLIEEPNGNDMQAVVNVLQAAQSACHQGKPVMILLHTTMGKGVDFMENKHQWHGKPPSQSEFEQAMAQLPQTLGDY